jgi:glycosyltransferase involved in cell wall biosynthesis
LKINYVGYFNPFFYNGGGEMVMRSVLEAGMRKGHAISVSSVRPRRMAYDLTAQFDFLADVFNYPCTLKSRGAWLDFSSGFIQGIAENRPFIHFSNAYADVCNLGYLPCSGKANPVCPHKSIFNLPRNLAAKDFSAVCFAERSLVRSLFLNSRLNVFVSPLHHRVIYNILGMKNEVPEFIIKPVIDGSLFYNRNEKRDMEYLFVGVIGEAKGLAEMRRLFCNKDIHFIGKTAPGNRLDFGVHHGFVPYAKVPDFMNRARNFVFMPRWPEPQGRVVIEAALCGCNLVVNDNVGATSFPFDISDISNFRHATEEFWGRIEEMFNE